MFEGLKKKFSNFIGGLTNKEKEVGEKEEEEIKKQEEANPAEVKTETRAIDAPKGVTAHPGMVMPGPANMAQHKERMEEKTQPQKVEQAPADAQPKVEIQLPKSAYPQLQPEKKEEKPAEAPKQIYTAQKDPLLPKDVAPPKPAFMDPKDIIQSPKQAAPEPAINEQAKVEAPSPRPMPSAQKPAAAPKVTFTTRLKSVIFRQVKISEKDADPFIDSLKMELLQSDVNYDVAEKLAASIRSGLIGKSVDSKNIESEITAVIRESIMQVLSRRTQSDLISRIYQKRNVGGLPFKIMFVGPNGAGKTTTMAKITNMLLANNITCVLSASDTFRAAAIEQTIYHAGKLGVNVIKGPYGADPASVAFDAIAHAKAHGIMAVLIDSAGRQETNKSLIEELRKMARVTDPDMKIFVGEAISGNSLLEQVKAINEAVKLDGIILTKLDVDAKGGNTLSILSDTTVPILYFGTGEKYTDIIPYDPQFIIDSILPNN